MGYAKTSLKDKDKGIRPVDLVRGMMGMKIYSDIVNTSLVGSDEVPLLRRVCVNESGDVVNQVFEIGEYVRVSKPFFHDVLIEIFTDDDEPFPFADMTKVWLTLHFRYHHA